MISIMIKVIIMYDKYEKKTLDFFLGERWREERKERKERKGRKEKEGKKAEKKGKKGKKKGKKRKKRKGKKERKERKEKKRTSTECFLYNFFSAQEIENLEIFDI